jgi:hypothetical protein
MDMLSVNHRRLERSDHIISFLPQLSVRVVKAVKERAAGRWGKNFFILKDDFEPMSSRMRILGKSVSILAIRVILVVLILLAMISTVVWLSYSGAAMFVNYEPNATKIAGMAFLMTLVTIVVGISGIIFVALYKSRYTEQER